MKRPGFLIVWPAHLDSSKTRGQGRRLPVSRAVKQPSLKEVWQAAMSLGYSPESKEKAALSGSPWEKTGYVTIKKTGQRTIVLKGIAGEIVKTRQKEAQAAEQKKR
ncbi:MAG TPA: signal recognition particle subunit SRP19/SEC65 family protein [Candidatus Angelobacter sp.]|nr:signal recognition particle subunit SRP19/SEC65 family protein [Candidatus Angelobacter sp.]